MRLTVTTLTDEIFTLEVSDDMELDSFKALCELETGMPAHELVIFHNGRPLPNNTKALKDFGISDGDMILLQRIQGVMGQQPSLSNLGGARGGATGSAAPPQIDFSQIQIPGATGGRGGGGAGRGGATATPGASLVGADGSPDPATLRELLLSSPHDLATLRERNPPLAEALLSGNIERFTEVLRQQQRERMERERERIRLLTADPFDSDAQQRIAEEIRLRNVEHNMETAMEHSPENFGQVIMLYVDCTVNGHPVKAFVDSGAQMTIMSQSCAERCNIMRLVDTRWAGVAKGVGTQRIIGRVHLCQIQIGSVYLQSSFSILEDQPMDMLLGLDMLKRHQCTIDLKENVLKIGTSPGVQTQFLNESELPEHARLNRPVSDTETMMDDDRQLAEALARSQADSTAGGAGPSTPRNTNQNAASTTPTTATTTPSPASTVAPPSQPASTNPAASQPADSYSEVDISRLTGYGFSRLQVIEELRGAQGNVDQALASLFAKSFLVP